MAHEYQPVRIMDLPDELVLQVVSNLHAIRSSEPQSQAFKFKEHERSRQCENDKRQKALHGLCLTSRRLRRISEPILYSSFVGSSTWYGFRPLKLFHQTIIKQPSLARHIQYVENRLSDYLGHGLYDDMEFYGAVDMVQEYFFRLAAIINLAPNIQHLSVVSLETTDVSLWNPLLLGNKLDPQITMHGFPKLQKLCLQIQTEDYGIGEESGWFRRIAEALINVPTLKELRASGVTPGNVAPLVGKYKSLDTIDISECILDFEEVVQLTSACDKLKHFSCHWAFLNCNGSHPVDLYPGLSPHKNSLESLLLDVREVRFHYSPFVVEPLGSIRDFTALKSVTICGVSLLATTLSILDFPDQRLRWRVAELLPPSLESLTLLLQSSYGYDDDLRIDEAFALWDLAEDCERLLPNLKEVQIKSRFRLAAPNLTKQFCEAGMVLSFEKELESTYHYN